MAVHTVAITRWGAPLEQELAHLAELMGMAPYDARLKLAGPLPVILAPRIAPRAARSMLESLRRRGHGAVVCDLDTLPTPERILMPRGFEFRADELVAIEPSGRRTRVAYRDIIGLIHAAEVVTESAVTETVETKFSMRRAAMTGGLVRNTKVVTRERSYDSEREQVLYVFSAQSPDPMRLSENGLRYEGLGEHRGATRNASFGIVVEWLRGHARGAVYDDRMMREKRRATGLAVQLTHERQVVQNSNRRDNDMAAFLLMHAHIQRQI